MAVSSANIAIVVSFLMGMSAVNIMYKTGHSTLPCGTPESMGKFTEVAVLNFIWE